MALTLSESAKQERKLPEAGATVGVLYSLVDLGHQKTNWDNQEKWTPKVRLTFELPDQTDEFEVEEKGKVTKVEKPMIVSIEQTRSLGEKASLRKLLEQWRGQTFILQWETTSVQLEEPSWQASYADADPQDQPAGQAVLRHCRCVQATQRHEGSSYHH